MLVGYGIAAVVILVLLIVFNVRASRRSPQAGNAQGDEPAQPAEPAERAESTAEGQPVITQKESGMEDTGYRSALRQFQSQPPVSGKRAPATKPSISDTDYRAALRKQKSGKKENE